MPSALSPAAVPALPTIPSPKRVVISGDAPLTWRVVRDGSRRDGKPTSVSPDKVRVNCQPNGWVLMYKLLKYVMPGGQVKFYTPVLPPERLTLGSPELQHSVTMWSQYQARPKGPGDGKADAVYRLDDYLGWECGGAPRTAIPPPARAFHQVRDDPPEADLVVLDDWGLGYRMAQHLWPLAIRRGGHGNTPPPWVLVKLSHPLMEENTLCKELLRNRALRDHVILLVSANDLRRMDIELSREMSWDQAAYDLLRALHRSSDLRYFRWAAATVISFDDAGAMVYTESPTFGASREPTEKSQAYLFFRPRDTEWVQGGGHRGRVPGQLKCLTAALAAHFTGLPANPPPEQAVEVLKASIRCGLTAGKQLFDWGYGTEKEFAAGEIRFPVQRVAEWIRPQADGLATDPETSEKERQKQEERKTQRSQWMVAEFVAAPLGEMLQNAGRSWSILDKILTEEELKDLAEKIVRNGLNEALKDRPVPVGLFGKLTTLDRNEIMSYRNIRRLLAEYARTPQTKPLSIAVFGQPGCGKSFAVRQLAEDVVPPGQKIDFLTFNLSQFSSPKDLLGALHQVRDAGLSGKLPIVFWDEFDSPLQDAPLGWLRYFLAPMEDGQFQEGQITHPIGPAVFVFAGGTCHTFDQFDRSAKTAAPPVLDSQAPTDGEQAASPDDGRAGGSGFNPPSLLNSSGPGAGLNNHRGGKARPKKALDDWRRVKGPDFVSRLKGKLDIPGLNPPARASEVEKAWCWLRRAILLRSSLEDAAPHLIRDKVLEIDEGVLRAFLRTAEYRHGVRSLKAVLAMSLLSGRHKFERSCLPEESQLRLHVNAADFKLWLNEQDPVE